MKKKKTKEILDGCPTFAPLTLYDWKPEIKVEWIREWLWENKITGFYTLGDQYGLSEDIICAKLTDFLNEKLKPQGVKDEPRQ